VTADRFAPLEILGVLDRHGVAFVLIGGVAGRLHGSPSLTGDLDICYDRRLENLERLAAALVEFGARLRGVDDGVPFLPDARTLAAGSNFTFTTTAGPLDLLGSPAGVRGYDELAANAEHIDVGGVMVAVADLDDLIRMKLAAGGPKDRVEVEILGALRDERSAGAG
jgi:hypothetical protein